MSNDSGLVVLDVIGEALAGSLSETGVWHIMCKCISVSYPKNAVESSIPKLPTSESIKASHEDLERTESHCDQLARLVCRGGSRAMLNLGDTGNQKYLRNGHRILGRILERTKPLSFY